jgi:hypothetical protein
VVDGIPPLTRTVSPEFSAFIGMCLEISVSARASSQELLRVTSSSNLPIPLPPPQFSLPSPSLFSHLTAFQHPFILKAGNKDDMKRLIRRTKQLAKQKEVDDRETMQKLFG